MPINKEERSKAIRAAQEINQGEINKDYFDKDYDTMKKKSLVQLAMRNKEGVRGATEFIKNYLLEINNFYTLRDSTEQLWIYQEGVYVPHAETYVKDFCSKVFEQAYTDRLAKEVIDKIKARTYINPDDFFLSEPTHRICCANGVLDLRSKELSEHTPDEFHFSKIPVIYYEDAYPHSIEMFFEEVLANPDQDLDVMRELLGWLLVKEYKPEKTVMFYGEGRNGKGKTLEILRRFIGKDNYSSKSLHELDPRSIRVVSLLQETNTSISPRPITIRERRPRVARTTEALRQSNLNTLITHALQILRFTIHMISSAHLVLSNHRIKVLL